MQTVNKRNLPSLPLRYCNYRRVSHPDQVERDLSLPEQGSQQRVHIEKRGGIVAYDLEDAAISGEHIRNRPAFLQMIDLAKAAEFDVLLIHKSDRSFRNRFEAVTTKAMLRSHGIKMESVTEPWFGGDDPEDQLIEGIMECVAEWYRGNLAKEFKKGIRAAANIAGRQQGVPPFGYQWANPGMPRAGWKIVPADAERVRWAFDQVAHGGMIVPDLCREFNRLGIPNSLGRFPGRRNAPQTDGWYPQAMRFMLRNDVYLGVVKADGERFDGKHEAIIEPEIFAQVQLLLDARGPKRSETSGGMFSGGLLRCPICAEAGEVGNLGLNNYRNAAGEQVPRYDCVRGRWLADRVRLGISETPGHRYAINEEVVVRCLKSGIDAVLTGVDVEAMAREQQARGMKNAEAKLKQAKRQASTREEIVKEIESIPALRSRAQWQQLSGFMTDDEFAATMKTIQARQEDASRRLQEIDAVKEEKEQALDVDGALRIWRALHYESLTVRQRRDLLRLSLSHIIPAVDKKTIRLYTGLA